MTDTVKDYSHIKRGMYVLISELGSNKVAVEEAFIQSPDFCIGPTNYLDYREEEYRLGLDEDGVVGTWGFFNAKNPKQVSVDFILNGPEKEEDTPTHPYQVGTKWMCGEYEVLIVHLDKNLKYEEEYPLVLGYCSGEFLSGCFYTSGKFTISNNNSLQYDLTPIKTPLQIELEEAKLKLEEAQQVVLELESKIKQQEEL